MYIISLRN